MLWDARPGTLLVMEMGVASSPSQMSPRARLSAKKKPRVMGSILTPYACFSQPDPPSSLRVKEAALHGRPTGFDGPARLKKKPKKAKERESIVARGARLGRAPHTLVDV